MSSRSADFNYKVALASGLRSLQAGRLRQAEEQFRYLVQHFPSAVGGYRGLAKVLVEQDDRVGALRVLLEGGAALAKSGERATAIALYREAVSLEPTDLGAHRRLAAALALAGETDGAAHEYVRYITTALAADAPRAHLEAAYAMERLAGNPEVEELARTLGRAPAAAEESATADEPAPSSSDRESPRPPGSSGNGPQGNGSHDPRAAAPPPTPEATAPEPNEAEADDDTSAVEATAVRYLATGDPRGGQHAIEAARRHLAAGRIDAASDLLLQLIAAGISDYDAQRLLVEVTRSIGKSEVAKTKVRLLVKALRLDGRAELAAEVEQLAQAF